MTTSFLICDAVKTLVVELLFVIAYTAPVLYILYANYATLKQERDLRAEEAEQRRKRDQPGRLEDPNIST